MRLRAARRPRRSLNEVSSAPRGLETGGISNEVHEQLEFQPEPWDKDPAVRAFVAMKELVGTSSILNVLHRYDVRFDRAYFRAVQELKERQRERISKPNRETAALFT